MAIGILISNECIKETKLEKTVFIGELSLDGKINKVNRCISYYIRSFKIRNRNNNFAEGKCKRGCHCARY